MKAYLVDEDCLTKLSQLYKVMHNGTDRERDYGHRLWLICAEITHPNNEVEVTDKGEIE
jgi:hypothetical protein